MTDPAIPFNSNVVALASAAIERARRDKDRTALRAIFEEIAWHRYCEKVPEESRSLTAETLCTRRPDGQYQIVDIQQTWWGFQAGFDVAGVLAARL